MQAMPAPIALPAAFGHDRSDRRIAVLREVGATGSISQAARVVGISYKAAWQAIDTLTTLAGAPLVERAVGGAGGGGAVLAPAAHDLLAAAQAMSQARAAVLAQWQSGALGHSPAGVALARLTVRTSMRNQLPCVVERLEVAGALARVVMALGAPPNVDGALVEASGSGRTALVAAPGGARKKSKKALHPAPRITASITRESAELLGLAPGVPVLAMCKATAVRVERAVRPAGFAAPGRVWLSAKAVRVQRGSLGDEIAAQVWWDRKPMGLQIVGFATPASGLRIGSALTLSLEENAVVLALAHD